MRDDRGSVISIWLITLLLLAGGCSDAKSTAMDRTMALKEQSMNLETDTALWTPAVPLMDLAAPAAYETATFGLG